MRKFNVVMIGPEEMWDIPEEIISRLNAPLAKEVDRVELPIDSDEEDEGYGSFGKQFMDLSLFAAVEKEEENDSKLAIREGSDLGSECKLLTILSYTVDITLPFFHGVSAVVQKLEIT